MSGVRPTGARCSTFHNFYRERARLVKLKQDAQRKEELQFRLKADAEKAARAREKKQTENVERVMRGLARDEKIQDARQRIKDNEECRRRNLAASIVTKGINAHMRQTSIKEFNMANGKEKKAMDWLNRKYEASKKQVEQEAFIQAAAKADLKQKAAKRQDLIERNREERPFLIAARKHKVEWELRLVKKFAMIWLNKVRARVRKSHDFDDDQHKSVWVGREGHKDPMIQAQRDLMKMEPALKAIMGVLHKEKAQAVAEKYSRALHRNSRGFVERKTTVFKLIRRDDSGNSIMFSQ